MKAFLWAVLVVALGVLFSCSTAITRVKTVEKKVYVLVKEDNTVFNFIQKNKNKYVPTAVAQQVADAIETYSKVYGLSPKLVAAIAYRESEFCPWAHNTTSYGTMAINKAFWPVPTDVLFDINENVRTGCYILRHYIDKYGLPGALHAYNVGETDYRKGVRNLAYVSFVMDRVRRMDGGWSQAKAEGASRRQKVPS